MDPAAVAAALADKSVVSIEALEIDASRRERAAERARRRLEEERARRGIVAPAAEKPAKIEIHPVHAHAIRGPREGRWYWRARAYSGDTERTVWTGWGTREEVHEALAVVADALTPPSVSDFVITDWKALDREIAATPRHAGDALAGEVICWLRRDTGAKYFAATVESLAARLACPLSQREHAILREVRRLVPREPDPGAALVGALRVADRVVIGDWILRFIPVEGRIETARRIAVRH